MPINEDIIIVEDIIQKLLHIKKMKTDVIQALSSVEEKIKSEPDPDDSLIDVKINLEESLKKIKETEELFKKDIRNHDFGKQLATAEIMIENSSNFIS